MGVAVRGVARRDGGVTLNLDGNPEAFTAAILAVAPHQLATALGADGGADEAWRAPLAQVEALTWESITTVYLAYADAVSLALPVMRLDDAPGQWAFDRSSALPPSAPEGARGLIAVVISTSGPHDTQDQGALAADADAQLRKLAGLWPLPVWSRVIAERRATYACTPARRGPRPGASLPVCTSPGITPTPSFPPRSKRRRAVASRPPGRSWPTIPRPQATHSR